jgi:hypothetical protein
MYINVEYTFSRRINLVIIDAIKHHYCQKGAIILL